MRVSIGISIKHTEIHNLRQTYLGEGEHMNIPMESSVEGFFSTHVVEFIAPCVGKCWFHILAFSLHLR